MSGFIKNIYAFVNLGMAGFVLATVAARFVFPAVSAEGPAFWIIRTSPISMRDFLWSKFWTGLAPVLVLTEGLTVAANELLGVDPLLKIVSACAIVLLSFALVGLATGLGARYPRFTAENPSQVAGSYGGVAFMILAVLLTIVIVVLLGWPSTTYLIYKLRRMPIGTGRLTMMALSCAAASAISITTWLIGMRSGVRALEAMSD
jgi:ABC-2 type transport system permease protein